MDVAPYRPEDCDAWNSFVDTSKNGTFLFRREYMEYHADRFTDASLVVFKDGRIVALFPACTNEDRVFSHAGLTYGGFVVDETMTTPRMLEVFDAVAACLNERGTRSIVYKTVPHIYHRLPAEEDRYALFRHGALLVRRDVLSVVPGGRPVKYQERRRRGVRRAHDKGVSVLESGDFPAFWGLLTVTLEARHGVRPVHSIDEMLLLAGRFPKNIRLFTALQNNRVVAGAVVYESTQVAHVQYIASNDEGRELGALDAVFDELIRNVYGEKPYFDFGISTESDGRVLNAGLVEQKEGFGARAVAHDHYEMPLSRGGG